MFFLAMMNNTHVLAAFSRLLHNSRGRTGTSMGR